MGGRISLFFLGDATHNSFDNLAFADATTLQAAEDRGDDLHDQLTRSTRFGPSTSTALATLHGSSPRASDVGRMPGTDLHARKARAIITEQHGENRPFEIVFDPDHANDRDDGGR